jgi:hypothetical protein
MVSFDIVSLFTRLPIKETMDLLGCHFEEDVLGLFRQVLTTSYFTTSHSKLLHGGLREGDV